MSLRRIRRAPRTGSEANDLSADGPLPRRGSRRRPPRSRTRCRPTRIGCPGRRRSQGGRGGRGLLCLHGADPTRGAGRRRGRAGHDATVPQVRSEARSAGRHPRRWVGRADSAGSRACPPQVQRRCHERQLTLPARHIDRITPKCPPRSRPFSPYPETRPGTRRGPVRPCGWVRRAAGPRPTARRRNGDVTNRQLTHTARHIDRPTPEWPHGPAARPGGWVGRAERVVAWP